MRATTGHRGLTHLQLSTVVTYILLIAVTVVLIIPVVYLISGLRWAFYGAADVHIGISTGMTLMFMLACLGAVWWVFKTGHRIRR